MRRRERGNRQGHYERAEQRHLILPFSYSNQDLFCATDGERTDAAVKAIGRQG
jgi:hypothetical protein